MTGSARQRCGSVAVLGLANAGKSTLINRIAGAPVSIVTHKAQTTRSRVRGIARIGESQVVLVDTPGLFRPRGQREQRLLREAWHGIEEADAVVVVVDSAALNRHLEEALVELERNQRRTMPRALALNKIDRVRRSELLPLAAALSGLIRFDATFMISARSGSGVDALSGWLAAAMPEGVWRHPSERVCDEPDERRAEEATRRQLLLRFHDEIPYRLRVATVAWRTADDGVVDAVQEVLVERNSQRKVVLGREKRALAAITRSAAKEIGRILDRPVRLELLVKVRRDSCGSASAADRPGNTAGDPT